MDREDLKALPYAAVGFAQGALKHYGGEIAWGSLLGAVSIYDVTCSEGSTLSEAFRRQPKALQVGEIALVGAHLLGILPERADPFQRLLKKVKGGKDGSRL